MEVEEGRGGINDDGENKIKYTYKKEIPYLKLNN